MIYIPTEQQIRNYIKENFNVIIEFLKKQSNRNNNETEDIYDSAVYNSIKQNFVLSF